MMPLNKTTYIAILLVAFVASHVFASNSIQARAHGINLLNASQSTDSTNCLDCPDTLGIYMMHPSGQYTVFINDINFASTEDCDTMQYRIWFSYLDSANYPDQRMDWQLPVDSSFGDDVLNYLPDGASFYCEILGSEVISRFNMRIYAIDKNGQWEYCETTIIIIDSFLVCDPGHYYNSLCGAVKNIKNTRITNVRMNIRGGPFENLSWNKLVDANGEYCFSPHWNHDWTVSGEKSDHYLNGVTAQDISLLSRHIVGLNVLSNPYKKLASDVNGDLNIDIRDVLMLRKLLLGIVVEPDDVSAWRIIDANYIFSGITDYSLPSDVNNASSIKFEPLIHDQRNVNFIGVKIGDLDGDADVGS